MSTRIESSPPTTASPPPAGTETKPVRMRPGAAVLLFALCLLIYNANLRGMHTSDAIPNMLLPLSILTRGTLTLDPFLEYFGLGTAMDLDMVRFAPGQQLDYYYLTASGNHVYSSYPIALPLLLLPLYAPVVWGLGLAAWQTRPIVAFALTMAPFAASVVAALSAVVMLQLVRRLASPRAALIVTLVYAFCTTAWTTSAEALWQQGASTLFLLLTLHALARAAPAWLRAGVWTALALAVRPSNVLLWVIVLGVMALERRRLRALFAFALPGAVTGALLAAYNLSLFGDLRGGYQTEPLQSFSPVALLGLLVSPSRGLLVYTPLVAFAAIGAWRVLREPNEHRRVYAVAAAYVIASLLLLSHLARWWGGASYGPRLLTESAAALLVLLVPTRAWILQAPIRRIAFVLAIAWSFATQALGAFCYPMGLWEVAPGAEDMQIGRLWNWNDTQLLRALNHCRGAPSPPPYPP